MVLPKVSTPVEFDYVSERKAVIRLRGEVVYCDASGHLEIKVSIDNEPVSVRGNGLMRRRSRSTGVVSVHIIPATEESPLRWVMRAPNSRNFSKLHGRIVVGVSWDTSYEYVKKLNGHHSPATLKLGLESQ